MGFSFDPSKLLAGLQETQTRLDVAVGMLCETSAKNLESDSKSQARWTDRTGDARKRLNGYTYRTSTGWRIVLAHGVDYGIWLELAHEKRFAIVGPMIDLAGPFIIKDFENLMDKLGTLGSGTIHASFDEVPD